MKKFLTACTLFACALCAQAYDIVATVSIEGDTKWYFDIELANNNIDFTAFQLDITLDGDAELKESDLEKCELIPSHVLKLAQPEGRYRVVGYSESNTSFKNTDGRLFTFSLDGDIQGITINKIIFAKPDGTEVEAADYTRALDRTGDPDAVKNVPAVQKENKVIYNMEGKQVFRIDRRGIYIENGKKKAIR